MRLRSWVMVSGAGHMAGAAAGPGTRTSPAPSGDQDARDAVSSAVTNDPISLERSDTPACFLAILPISLPFLN